MTIRIGLTHKTSYRYDRPISLGPQTIRLRPAPHTRTPIISYSQTVTPGGHFLNWQQDPFGNYQARAVFPDKTDHFDVTIDLVADMVAINPFDFFLDEEVHHVPFAYSEADAQDLAPYLTTDAHGAHYGALVKEARALWQSGQEQDIRTTDFLVALNQRLQERIGYVVRMEPGVQTPEDTLQIGKGSCRDSGWLLVNLLRDVGIAARFVSGYLVQLTADEKPVDGGAAGPEADFTDLHAWAEAYIPGAGWIGLDPTSGLFAGEGHIPLAATPAPQSAAPISGTLDPCEVSFDVEMTVTRLAEPARISKPFTDTDWARLDAAGKAIDTVLTDQDVRLTMGGEPTFIAASDRDADEWTIEAVGPTKRAYADRLARALRDAFAPGSLLTHGQGKWYPGEPLPRWAYSIVWRGDGQALWQNADLIAEEDPEIPATADCAASFISALSKELGLSDDYAQPLYEDPVAGITSEAALPANLSPADNKLDDPVERARMARVFERGFTTPTGFVLPLQVQQADATSGRTVRWMSELWSSRRDKLFLIPGDSPAGFRLPLESLPYLPSALYPHVIAQDPLAPRGDLPPVQRKRQNRKTQEGRKSQEGRKDRTDRHAENAQQAMLQDDGSGRWAVRTALVVEPRDGKINLFIPPVESAEAFVDLTAAIEAVAADTKLPVRIEGYPPPQDPRFHEIKVTPDPGVIEVNIHPTSSWDDLRDTTRTLYETARQVGLDTSGFQIDGRPTGSGGGAHVTVGGQFAEDSPFLRRPDVLASLIRFWQNHPSLSYMFAGMFIGPTSQAPRMDEARSDILYELDIALDQIPAPGGDPFPYWQIDRILRHLLVDVTGNTHRAEICIDKLYSPDSATGRLGLVEFRGFEMPPHWQMNVAQQLIIRALIAWFWQTPYTAPLIPFGTHLHDKYMLPDVLWHDFGQALDTISAGLGIGLDREWFRAQYDFRFPLIGQFDYGDVSVELRTALEPWHVLGEEGTADGVSRFVDNSLDRIQVKLAGHHMAPGLALTCAGRLLPLQPSPDGNASLAGVRFRTWLPASCLHPTIQPHGPLVFDLVDTTIGRSLAGCTYHVTHPGGRNFETRPINALEAEGRRLARFEAHGHTPGPISPLPSRVDPRFPYTLDLRRR